MANKKSSNKKAVKKAVKAGAKLAKKSPMAFAFVLIVDYEQDAVIKANLPVRDFLPDPVTIYHPHFFSSSIATVFAISSFRLRSVSVS